jgi:hypothetical protein
MKMRNRLLGAASGLALATTMAAAPASAQPTMQEGLVNVNLQDVDIAVPISVAANICDLAVNVLAEYARTGDTACTTTAESGAVFGPGGSGGTQQRGLVNVNVEDVTVLVPVSVAANICDVAVNVLARSANAGERTCTADAQSTGG